MEEAKRRLARMARNATKKNIRSNCLSRKPEIYNSCTSSLTKTFPSSTFRLPFSIFVLKPHFSSGFPAGHTSRLLQIGALRRLSGVPPFPNRNFPHFNTYVCVGKYLIVGWPSNVYHPPMFREERGSRP